MNKARHNETTPRPRILLAALLGALALLCLLGPAQALAVVRLEVDMSHRLEQIPADSNGRYEIVVSNSGDTNSRGGIEVSFTAPPGLRILSADSDPLLAIAPPWRCTIAPDALSANCTGPGIGGAVRANQEACQNFGTTCPIHVMARADEAIAAGTILTPIARVCGGTATVCPTESASASDPTEIVAYPPFDITGFDGGVLRENGDTETLAGAHPHTAFTEFHLTRVMDQSGLLITTEDLQDAIVRIPPGLVGNPRAVPTCTEAQLGGSGCPPESQVGTINLWYNGVFGPAVGEEIEKSHPDGVYNMVAPHGTPGVFGFPIQGVPIHVFPRVRTGEDYGITVTSKNAAESLPFEAVTFDFWGVPADPSHDTERGRCLQTQDLDLCPSSAQPPKPFISLPTSCVGAVETFLDVLAWQGGRASSSFLSHDNFGSPVGTEGCNSVPFAPTIQARPTTTAADAPSGLDVELRVPQSEDPDGQASAHLRDTVVTLPEGLVINPAGANGLSACSEADFGYTHTDPDATIHTTPGPASCPEASKVATVEVNSPLIDHPLKGSAHIATPYQNPFNSLLALYITIDDVQSGTVVKLAGEVSPDPATGQLTSTFAQNPQLPFETFELHFKSGAHGTLRTPLICGNHTTTSSLTPWSAPDSGPPATPSDTWAIEQGCVNSAAQAPNNPSFDAGAVSPLAGRHSAFVVKLRREDGSQNFSALTVRPPAGLVAKLAGTQPCPDAYLQAAAAKPGASEAAVPSCPPQSEIGTVVAAAGAGPAPYHAHGKAYLTGPYKSAPLSLAIITPATAGPFDLGTVVIRTALHVDPKTAAITAVSDPLSTILQGIPLDIRSADVALDRPAFALNGTSCDPAAVTGQLLSTLGQIAQLSSRFQLAECTGLGFKPKMALRLRGGTKRGKHPALTATLIPRAGDANIKSVSVALPRSEFLENAHIRTVCTRPDFAAERCPAGAAYGTSTVTTPLLDYPLTGNVYLRSSDNLLPDIVPDLRGPAYQPLRVEAAGRTDSVKGGIRNTFDFFPDAPFTRAVLRMQGGNKGLLVNSRNICARTYRAKVRFTAHNNKTHVIRPKLVAQGCKGKRKARRRGHKRSLVGELAQ